MAPVHGYADANDVRRRKYFSCDERLHIAQAAAAQKRKKQRWKQTWLSTSTSTDFSDPVSTSEAAVQHRPTVSHAAQRKSIRLQSDLGHITKEQADWFFGLPEKARKQYFSQEERTVLTKQCQQALDTAAFELSQLPGYVSLESDANESAQVADGGISNDTSQKPIVKASTEASESNETGSRTLEPVRTADSMGILDYYTRRKSSLATITNSRPNDVPSSPPSLTTPRPQRPPRRRRFHRRLSLKPIALPPIKLAPAPALPSPTTLGFQMSSRLSQPCEQPANFPCEDIPGLESDSTEEAAIYSGQSTWDSQNFDDTIEFGHPSSSLLPPSSGSDRPFAVRRTPSLNDVDCDASSLDSRGPLTPTAGIDQDDDEDSNQPTPFDSSIELPVQLNTSGKVPHLQPDHNPTGHYPHDVGFRITLTQPEPGDSQEELHSHQHTQDSTFHSKGSDPLALERLAVCEDHSGRNGAFANYAEPGEKVLKKVWKTLKKHVSDDKLYKSSSAS
ncbi:hypothetical protein D0869_09784 [Hortaea werneckii]|uniref:Uncharacterized protein n=1 Tax=Hortaea werneckii TaxID=91943 RepID=A0A3M6ZI67_HORWE|nr:hypothetical protein D0869_09784 [Hortaea werneckii]RMY14900.1 hypothetical protein D0868_01200 [Hortaea werneckii]RMY24768.1 hypothetical protein D0867_01162 [Hortaea werneckii]RMY31795.1 hypothetical protein D0866_07048 [Hortaea werneckii]